MTRSNNFYQHFWLKAIGILASVLILLQSQVTSAQAAIGYVTASTGAADATGAWSYTTSAPSAAGNLIIIQVLQDANTSATPISISSATNVEDLAGTDNVFTSLSTGNAVGSGTIAGRQHLFIGRALNTSAIVITGANSTADDIFVRAYEFSGVAKGTTLSAVIENSTAGTATNGAGTSTTCSDTAVVTLGADRLALNFVAITDDATNLAAFAGETGGDWALATAIYETATGTDGTLGLMSATVASAGTIDGGSDAITSLPWGVVGFALIPELSPTVALNTPNDAATDVSTTPNLVFTGTDGNADEIEYNVQVFNSNQAHTTEGGSAFLSIQGSGQTSVAGGQAITPTVTFSLAYLILSLKKTNSPTDNVYVEVRETSATGNLLATSDNLDASTLTGSFVEKTFTFASPPTLNSSTTYYLVINRSGAGDGTNYAVANNNSTTGANYSGGSQWVNLAGSWTEYTGRDLYFKTYAATPFNLDKFSVTPDATFAGTGDPHPWPSGNQVTYAVGVIDAYSEGNKTSDLLTYAAGNSRQAQSFTGDGNTLALAKFYLKKLGSPTGNITAYIYDDTGTFGSTGTPTGAALATSDTVDISTLTTSYQLVDFTFSGANQITITNAANYFLVIEYNAGDGSNALHVGADSSGVHPGNLAQYNGSWAAVGTWDVPFYIYSVEAPLTANTTYYWRVAGTDPSGSNTYGAWSTTRSFTTAAATPITISGTIYQTNESSAYDCSAATAITVRAATNGGASVSSDCTSSGGTYSITTVPDPGAANIPIVVYIDSAEGIKATTVTLSAAAATGITNLDLYVDRLIVTQESATALTNAHLATADNADAGIRYAVASSNLTVESGIELHVKTSKTFAPGGNVTTQGTGDFHLDDSSVFTGSASQAHVVGQNLVIDTSATFTAPTTGTVSALATTITGTLTAGGSSITLSGTSGTLFTRTGTFTEGTSTLIFNPNADVTLFSGATTVNNLQLSPTLATSGKTYTAGTALTINGNFTVNPTAASSLALTVNASGNITVAATGTTTLSGTTSGTSILDLRPASTDYNLTTGKLNIAAAGTLDATSTTTTAITLNATTSTLFTMSGSFIAGGSTVVFNPDAAVTLTSGTFQTTNAFNNISLTPAISTAGRTYTFGIGAIETTGDFLIQPSGTQLLTVAMAGNITVANNKTTTITRSNTATSTLVTGASNPAFSSGNISIATGGTLEGATPSSTSIITLTANGTPFAVTGTYTPGSTTIAYVPAATTGVNVTSTTYYNVTFNKASNTFSLQASGIVVTNDLTITAGVLDTVSASNFPITVGRHWTNTPGTGGFLPQQGTVTFNTTTTANITGTTTFYNFTAATAGKTLKFGDATTFTINGLLTLTGSAGPSYVTLDSVTGGTTQWTIKHLGTESISYASIANSACDGSSTDISVDDVSNFDAGNNGNCWRFPAVTETIHWAMDEAAGSTLNDRTSNGNTGTLGATTAAPAWQTPDQCVSGSCLYFDGTNDVVTGGTTDNIKSVSFWVKPTSTTTTILQLTSSAYINASSGTLAATGFTTPTFYVNGQPSKTISANTWSYVTVTTSTNIVADAIILGNNSASYFTGYMDEVKFFPTTLTAAQVRGHYAANASTDAVSASMGGTGSSTLPEPIAYWKFDEGYNTTANDSTSNINSLTLNVASWTNSGKFGKGWVGTGSNRLSRADDADFDFAAGDSFTISVWFKTSTDTNPGWQYLLTKYGTGAQTGYYFLLNDQDKITFVIEDSISLDSVTNTSDVYDGNWHQVIVVKTANTKLELYIDGQLQASDASITATSTLETATDLYLGDFDSGDGTTEFTGTIDDTRFYRTAMTADQIKAEYNQSSAVVLGAQSTASNGITPDNSAAREYCIPGDTSTCDTPVGEWKFDEGSGTSASDTSGNGFTGTATAGTSWLPGKFGSGIGIDGTHEVAMSTSTTLDMGTSDMTISLWAKIPSTNTEEYVEFAEKGGTATATEGYWFFWRKSTAYLSFRISNGATRISSDCTMSPSIEDDKWHFITATADRDGNSSMYVDGVLKCATSISSFNGVSIDNLAQTFQVNNTEAGSGVTIVDNLRVYKYLRTPAQIAWEYNQGAPIAHYKFDECSGTTAYNSVASANGDAAGLNGTVTIGATGTNDGAGSCTGDSSEAWFNGATGKRNSGLSFDGTNDYVAIADPGTDSVLDFSSGEQITLSGWFNPDVLPTAGNFMTLLTKGDTDGTGDDLNYGMFWGRESGGDLSFDLCYTNTSGSYHCYASDGSLPIAVGQWHHVAVTYTMATGSSARLYFNGQLVPATWTSATGNDAPNVTNEALWIGADNLVGGAATDEVMDGLIDEIKIFNYSLTPQQIKLIYTDGAVRFD